MRSHLRVCATLLVCLATACGGLADLQNAPPDAPFMAVSRGELSSGADGGPEVVGNSEHFYVAIAKTELQKKWFMSGYLTQWHPAENVPMRSLGTRVVSFAVQNGKLFVFDATNGKAWSDTLDPTIVVDAYPIVTDYAPFNALPNAANYVLFDPAAGQNKFNLVSDEFAAWYYVKFEIALSFLQKFRPLADGAAWDQVFTGYSDLPGPGVLAYEQPFQGSGTLSVTLRRYKESPDFKPTPFTSDQRFYFPSSNIGYVKNEPRLDRKTIKWNVQPGMQPIEWRISNELAALQADPQYAGIDVAGAITRGVEGWNAAFGFPVFKVVQASASEGPGDDDKNFVVIDRNPGAGLAFANWRENPNTGEIRGASVYFSSVFIQGALIDSQDAGVLDPIDAGAVPPPVVVVDAGPPPGPPVVPCAPNVVVSQVYGGNGTTSALNQDFVELHNRTDAPVSLAGWSLQYASAAGSSWQVAPLAGTIAPGGFFLVGLASTSGGTALPVPADLTLGLNLSATAGKVALVASVSALSGACPAAGAAVDFVGYGAASCGEAMPAPAASSTLSVARRDACGDADVNLTDFQAQAPAPRNAGSAAAACVCFGAVPQPMPMPMVPIISSADAGMLGTPNARPALTNIGWEAMPTQSVCALHGKTTVAIPAGLTRRQYVEQVIEHTISHEIGHTLGLRHNFKGSLASSSVMDYLRDDVGAVNPKPGAFDVAAVRFLYGLDAAAPAQPFCTDEDMSYDAQCDQWDIGENPLSTEITPRYAAKMRGQLAETGSLLYGDIFRMTRYVRAPATEAQRLEALNALMADVAPPLKPEVIALGPNAAAYADFFGSMLLGNLFVDPAGMRDPIQVNPALNDATFRARVIEIAKNIIVNSDAQRSFESRRAAVDVLKALQTYDALDALVASKPTLQTERATYNATGQALIDDLTRRIDLACSPYFVR